MGNSVPEPSDVEGALRELVERGRMTWEDYQAALSDLHGKGSPKALGVREEIISICGIPTRFVYPVTYRAAILLQRLSARMVRAIQITEENDSIAVDHFDLIKPLLECCYPDLARDPGIERLHLDAIAECIAHLGSDNVKQEIAKFERKS